MLCGPKASAGTRLSEEEQRTSAEEESPAEEPEDDVEAEADRVMREEAEREPTAEEEREASAEEFTRQALDILREQYPGRTEEKYMDQWTGGFGLKDKIWKGANVVHVIAHRHGIILGFIKVLLTAREFYTDEILVVEAGRRKGLASHLLWRAGCYASPNADLARLQVDVKNMPAVSTYKDGWGMDWWDKDNHKKGVYKNVHEESDEGHAFMEGKRAAVVGRAKAIADAKPLDEDIRFFVMAAVAMKDHEVDFVGIPEAPAPAGATEPAQASPPEEKERQDRAQQVADDEKSRECEQADAFDELSGDTMCERRGGYLECYQASVRCAIYGQRYLDGIKWYMTHAPESRICRARPRNVRTDPPLPARSARLPRALLAGQLLRGRARGCQAHAHWRRALLEPCLLSCV